MRGGRERTSVPWQENEPETLRARGSPSSTVGAMILLPGESILTQGEATLLDNGTRGGQLFLTDRRLVFEARASGLLRAGSTSTVLDFPIDSIRDAHVNRPRLGIPLITSSTLRFETVHGPKDFRVDHPEIWRRYLVRAKTTRASAGPAPRAPDVVVNVHVPPAPPARAPVVKVRCPYCKTVYDESLGKCPRCGARF